MIFQRIKFLIQRLLLTVCFLSYAQAQQDESWKIYDDTNVARIDITINPDTLAWIYDEQNLQSNTEHYAVVSFQNNHINETIDSVGFRLRGNTSRNAQKKSFKISFNTFIGGRKFYGIDKLNLNGEHNDPSIIRSKLCFDHFKKIGLTASRANHVEVYINGQYYGLYISVEHMDKDFLRKNFTDPNGNFWKCLYPADLNYLGPDPLLYINLNQGGRPAYDLTTNKSANDFSKLVRLINVLNNTPATSLPDSIEKIINVPDVLKYFAFNILTGSWDDYWSLMNNYYLYHIPSTDIFQLIPYDYDNTFGIDWFGINWTTANPYNFPKVVSGYRPLAERLMQNSQYRNLYTRFLNFYSSNVYNLSKWESRIDSIKAMITPYALADTFRTLDYGFTVSDFHNSYTSGTYQNQHVKFGLKQFVNFRNSSLSSQLNYVSAPPIVYRLNYEPAHPGPDDSIKITASIYDNNGLSEVSVYFRRTGSTVTETFPMTFTPVNQTLKVEEADLYTGYIPALGENGSGEFFIFARDGVNQTSFYPRTNPVFISVTRPAANNLFINEFLASNSTVIPDPSGEFDDWIELYNASAGPILLTGKYLTDKPDNLTKWQFTQPGLYINPGEYLLIWCDEQQGQPGIHTNFKLNADGEFIAIVDEDGVTVIDSITFGPQTTDISYGRFPDASENWIFFQSPTPAASNMTTTVNDIASPYDFGLTAFPNPFNPVTTIGYSLPEQTDVTLKIYDILGNEVFVHEASDVSPGTHRFIWNGVNSSGSDVSSGIYLARLNAGSKTAVIKLMMLK